MLNMIIIVIGIIVSFHYVAGENTSNNISRLGVICNLWPEQTDRAMEPRQEYVPLVIFTLPLHLPPDVVVDTVAVAEADTEMNWIEG